MKIPDPSSPYFSKRDLQLRYLAISLSLVPLVTAYLYNQSYRIPFVCPIRYFTGIPCPSCGMTRSLMSAVRGEWALSADYHLFGPVLVVFLCGTLVHCAVEVLTRRSISMCHQLYFYKYRFIKILLFVLVGYHLTRLIDLYQNGILITDFLNSPLGQFIRS